MEKVIFQGYIISSDECLHDEVKRFKDVFPVMSSECDRTGEIVLDLRPENSWTMPISGVSPHELNEVLQVNVNAVITLTRSLLPRLSSSVSEDLSICDAFIIHESCNISRGCDGFECVCR